MCRWKTGWTKIIVIRNRGYRQLYKTCQKAFYIVKNWIFATLPKSSESKNTNVKKLCIKYMDKQIKEKCIKSKRCASLLF